MALVGSLLHRWKTRIQFPATRHLGVNQQTNQKSILSLCQEGKGWGERRRRGKRVAGSGHECAKALRGCVLQEPWQLREAVSWGPADCEAVARGRSPAWHTQCSLGNVPGGFAFIGTCGLCPRFR